MNKILLFAVLLLSSQLFAQVTFDAEYNDMLVIVKFAQAGEKIVVINEDDNYPRTVNTVVKIYNLDNSLFKTIELGTTDSVKDVSQHIVNTDDKIELMMRHSGASTTGGADSSYFYIINEDLQEIFKSEEGWRIGNTALDSRIHEDQFMYQTSEGIKLVLEKYNQDTKTTKTRIYSLGGSATLSNKTASRLEDFKAYPNPSRAIVNIPYSALNGEVITIKVFDLNGKVIETKKADNQFNELRLNISNYAKGAYIYTVENSLGAYNGKFIKK